MHPKNIVAPRCILLHPRTLDLLRRHDPYFYLIIGTDVKHEFGIYSFAKSVTTRANPATTRAVRS